MQRNCDFIRTFEPNHFCGCCWDYGDGLECNKDNCGINQNTCCCWCLYCGIIHTVGTSSRKILSINSIGSEIKNLNPEQIKFMINSCELVVKKDDENYNNVMNVLEYQFMIYSTEIIKEYFGSDIGSIILEQICNKKVEEVKKIEEVEDIEKVEKIKQVFNGNPNFGKNVFAVIYKSGDINHVNLKV